MVILRPQNFSGISNVLSVHLFLAILEGILLGGISSKETAELETDIYTGQINPSYIPYTIKYAWNITSLQELLLQPASPRTSFTGSPEHSARP